MHGALVLLALLAPLAAAAPGRAQAPHAVILDLEARFRDAAFARSPFLEGLAQLRFEEAQPWAVELPESPQLRVEGDAVAGRVRVSAPGAPGPGARLPFRLGTQRFDVALEGLRFERVELATGARFEATLPVRLQVADPSWVGVSASLVEIAGLRTRLQVRVENRSAAPFTLAGLRIRAEHRRARRPEDCAAPPEAERPRVAWQWRASPAGPGAERTASVPLRVGGCELQWMTVDLPVERAVAPGTALQLMAVPLRRAGGEPPPIHDARVDELGGWDQIRVSLLPPGDALPREVVLRPRSGARRPPAPERP